MNLKERLRGGARLQIAGRLGEAEHIHQEVLAEALRNADAVHLLGLIRGDQDRDEEAIRMVEEAIAINPRAAPFHHNVAGLYRRLGRLENVEASFRVAIELYPQYGEAYQGLAEMRKFAPGDPLLPRPSSNSPNRCCMRSDATSILRSAKCTTMWRTIPGPSCTTGAAIVKRAVNSAVTLFQGW